MSDEPEVQPPPTVVMAQLLDGFPLSQALFVLGEAGFAVERVVATSSPLVIFESVKR